MSDDLKLLAGLYQSFNVRDLETALALLHPDVVWANGMEGGHVTGRDEVRDYWTRQWAIIDPHVEPESFAIGRDGEITVEVKQTVLDLAGKLLAERLVGHVFMIDGGLVRRFDIRAR